MLPQAEFLAQIDKTSWVGGPNFVPWVSFATFDHFVGFICKPSTDNTGRYLLQILAYSYDVLCFNEVPSNEVMSMGA